MREINVSVIEKAVEEIFLKANSVLPESLEECINESKNKETSSIAKNIFCDMCKNLSVAKELNIPI